MLDKTDFDTIYDRPDPRAYYATLAPLDYQIPEHGREVTTRLLAQRQVPDPTVLDVCCSYGVLAMLLRTDLDLGGLTAHYTDPALAGADPAEVAAADRRLLRERPAAQPPRVVGLDVAGNAVSYAVETGALADGAVENLETDEPTDRLRDLLGEVDLVTTTGGVGYVGSATYDRLAELTPPTTWFATFCLRTYDFAPVADALAAHGLRTETAPDTRKQRRFTGADEQRWAVAQARALGFDTTGKEESGCFHAQLHLSRPAADVAAVPLAELLPDYATAD